MVNKMNIKPKYKVVRPGVEVTSNNKTKKYKFYCMDCKTLNPDIFMVHDEIWLKIFKTCMSGGTCLIYFEKRLNKKIKLSDLKDITANEIYFHQGISYGQV